MTKVPMLEQLPIETLERMKKLYSSSQHPISQSLLRDVEEELERRNEEAKRAGPPVREGS